MSNICFSTEIVTINAASDVNPTEAASNTGKVCRHYAEGAFTQPPTYPAKECYTQEKYELFHV